jgi:hypothetical protein
MNAMPKTKQGAAIDTAGRHRKQSYSALGHSAVHDAAWLGTMAGGVWFLLYFYGDMNSVGGEGGGEEGEG